MSRIILLAVMGGVAVISGTHGMLANDINASLFGITAAILTLEMSLRKSTT